MYHHYFQDHSQCLPPSADRFMTKIQSSHFKWKGSYALNARKAYSQKISLLRSVLREHYEKIHLSTDTQNEPEQLLSQRPQKSYVLAAVVSNYLEENLTSVVSFDDVIKHIKCSDNILSRGGSRISLRGVLVKERAQSAREIFKATPTFRRITPICVRIQWLLQL